MTLYNISKVDQLFHTLDNCQGDVQLVTPDGNSISWKQNKEVLESMWSAMPDKTIDKLEVRMSNTQDTLHMMEFLIRGNCA